MTQATVLFRTRPPWLQPGALTIVLCLFAFPATGLAIEPEELRALIAARVGDPASLRVPAENGDLPQPTLADGTLDPRFRITPAKAYLGKLLYFDPVRSTDIREEFGGLLETAQTASCGACHMGETASKAGTMIALGVGGHGRHEMSANGDKEIVRTGMLEATDVLPTGLDMLDAAGEVIASGSFDALDAPGRSAPSMIGVAFNQRLLWGGAAGEPNPDGYPAQEHVARLAMGIHRMASPDQSHLQAIPAYMRLFAEAFPEENARYLDSGDPDELINLDTQARAIAAFLRTVITRDTPWDRFLAGDDAALSPRQLRGAYLFLATADAGGANCIACHSGPALNKVLGDEAGRLVEANFHNLGTAEHPIQELARETLADPEFGDVGRQEVTAGAPDAFKFKAPTLRQARDAGPYFHGGQVATLREAIAYHIEGLGADPRAVEAGTLAPAFVAGADLDASALDDLTAFVADGLYDRGFVTSDPASPTRPFDLTAGELTYSPELRALGAVDGWLPSGMPNGVNDTASRDALIFVRGESGNDDRVDATDAVVLLRFLFLGEPGPHPMVAGDVNDDGWIDVSDPVYLLRFLFTGERAPPLPFPEPGQDLTF